MVSYLVRRRPLPVASGAATVAMTADIMTGVFFTPPASGHRPFRTLFVAGRMSSTFA